MSLVSLALVSTLFSQSPTSPKTEALGFVEVLERIHTNSKLLEQARAGVEIADGQVQKAWTGWQPTVSAVGQLTFNSVKQEIDFGPILQGAIQEAINAVADQLGVMRVMLPPAPSNPSVIQPHVQWAGVLQASQTLFNITVLRAPGVAKAARRAADARVDSVEDELLFQGATLFASIVGLEGLEAAAERASKVADQRINEAKIQLEAGTATKLVVTRAETDKISAESQRITVQTQVRTFRSGLAVLMGSKDLVAVRGEPIAPALPAKAEALERTSVRAKRLEQEAAEASIGLSNLAWLPTLQADGNIRYSNVSGFADDKFVASATLNLVIPLYDKGVRYADTRIAEAQSTLARRALEQEELASLAFLEQAKAELEAAKANLAQAEAQLKLANESVAQAEELVRNGLATSLDLTDADSRRFAADQSMVQKKLSLDLAVLRVHYASGGRLIELLEAK